MNKILYHLLFISLVLADHDINGNYIDPVETPTSSKPSADRHKASKKSYQMLYIGVTLLILWLVIDLWVIMSDKKKEPLPYYLEPTESMKQKEIWRLELIKKAAIAEAAGDSDKYQK